MADGRVSSGAVNVPVALDASQVDARISAGAVLVPIAVDPSLVDARISSVAMNVIVVDPARPDSYPGRRGLTHRRL